jgi:hypothetical protein
MLVQRVAGSDVQQLPCVLTGRMESGHWSGHHSEDAHNPSSTIGLGGVVDGDFYCSQGVLLVASILL